ncbi:hypothetical protein [Kitasatospora sp. NPDC085464]|uniref:hypothetical protein n=1 Tax=Kitasatospora sp. NPDC085464 TaxID=3364063 RepID=UPI0037CAEE98
MDQVEAGGLNPPDASGCAGPADLSGAQGSALRELQRQAAVLRAQGPLPSGWAAAAVRRACASIAAAAATAGARPTGWP